MRCPYDQEMLEKNTDVVMGINFLLDKSQEFSKFWQDICAAWEIFKRNITCGIGNGQLSNILLA